MTALARESNEEAMGLGLPIDHYYEDMRSLEAVIHLSSLYYILQNCIVQISNTNVNSLKCVLIFKSVRHQYMDGYKPYHNRYIKIVISGNGIRHTWKP